MIVWKEWIVHNFWRCSTGLLATVLFRQRLKGRRCKAFKRKKEQNKSEHGESTIDSMHVLVIPLGSVDSVLFPVFASDCKQRTAFVALPLRSSYSQHTLHVIESCQSLPKNCQSGLIWIETTSQSGMTQTGSKSTRLEPA